MENPMRWETKGRGRGKKPRKTLPTLQFHPDYFRVVVFAADGGVEQKNRLVIGLFT